MIYCIGYIVGSFVKDLINWVLLKFFVWLVLLSFEFVEILICDFLLYNCDDEFDLVVVVIMFKYDVECVEGLLFVFFEYNCFIFGVLKNVIDWGLWLWGYNFFVCKFIGIIGVLIGVIGIVVMQLLMCSVLSFFNVLQLNVFEVYIIFKLEFFGEDGEVIDFVIEEFFCYYMSEYVVFVECVVLFIVLGYVGDQG